MQATELETDGRKEYKTRGDYLFSRGHMNSESASSHRSLVGGSTVHDNFTFLTQEIVEDSPNEDGNSDFVQHFNGVLRQGLRNRVDHVRGNHELQAETDQGTDLEANAVHCKRQSVTTSGRHQELVLGAREVSDEKTSCFEQGDPGACQQEQAANRVDKA